MVTNDAAQDVAKKRRLHTRLAAATALLGVALMIYMIIWEDEPGAIPLLLIAAGIGWFVVTRLRMRPGHG